MTARRASFETAPPRRFSREWVLTGLRTAVWVAIITVLIWVYADVYFTEERAVRVTLQINAGSADNMVLLSDPAVTIRLQVKGRRYALDRFAGARLSYDAAKAMGSGLHAGVRTVDVLESLFEVRQAGVEIISARPKALNIHLDTLEKIPDVPVRFDFTGGAPTDVTVAPDRIDLFVPAQRINEINRERLRLLTETVDLRDKPAGQPITMDVHVRAPDIPGCRTGAQTVRVTFTVGQQAGKKQFRIPIRVQSPKDWLTGNTWSQYKLVLKDPQEWTKKITVKGNRIDLEKLRPEDIEAYIVLTEDAKRPTASWLSGAVHVRFPKALKVQAEPVLPVSYRLMKQTGTTP